MNRSIRVHPRHAAAKTAALHRRAARAITVALLALGSAPIAATGASYPVTSCPSAPTVGAPPNAFLATYRASVNDRCASGQGFGLGLGGPNILDAQTVNGTVGFQIAIPDSAPNVTITRTEMTLTVAGKSGDADSSGRLQESVGAPDLDAAGLLFWGGGRTQQIGPTGVVSVGYAGVRKIFVSAACVTQCVFDQLPNQSGNFLVGDLKLTLSESTPPHVPSLSAPPTAPVPSHSSFPLAISASDVDSGIGEIAVFSGTKQVADFTPTDCKFAEAAACPLVRTVTLPIDTGMLPLGSQTLTVIATDVAGNKASATSGAFTIEPAAVSTPTAGATPVAPGATPLPNGNSKGKAMVVGGTRRTAPALKAEAISTSFGHPIDLIGRVLAADRTPMAGVTVDVVQTVALPGAAPVRLITLTTDAHGVYRYRLRATASSTVVVGYPDDIGSTVYTATRTVNVAVRAGVSLSRTGPARRGSTSVFAGKVQAAPFPTAGVRAVIQYHSSSGWQDVKVVRTDAKGAFSWRHRFRVAASYRFRARVLSEPTLAARPGTSRELHVTIR